MIQMTPNAYPVSVVVPARNEAQTIARVLETLIAMPMIDEIVVVDNDSTDDTAAVARAAGARVVTEQRPGMGHAIRAGFIAARNNWVMKVDADLDRFDIALFSRMIETRGPGVGLVKGQWQDPRDPMPMTRYLVMPALQLMFPTLGHLGAPNSGVYIFDRSLIALPEIVGDYAADLDVMLRVAAAGAQVTEVDIGRIDNNPRDPSHYASMTETIMAFFLRQRDLRITEERVVFAESAEQVVAAALGVIAGHARSGGRVSVYLAEGDGAEILRDVLAPYPTVRIAPLTEAAGFSPGAAASHLRLFSSSRGAALSAATALLQGSAPMLNPELLMIPSDDASGEEVRPDRALNIAEGYAIKQAALARMGRAAENLPQTETFQSYPSRI